MTYETHIVARTGRMEKGQHVTEEALAAAVELETGLSAEGKGATDEEAVKAAEQALADRVVAEREKQEEADRRAAEDPMARLARLEAIVKEAGLDA